MHSPFTFNPNAHRATSNYQQQQQQIGYQKPLFNIGTPMNHSQNLLVNHCAFTRSFASVVSCENNLGMRQNMGNVNKGSTNQNSNSNSGIIGSFLKHFKPTTPQYPSHTTDTHHNKEFEDYRVMPTLSATHLPTYNAQPQQHYYQQSPTSHINIKMSTPSDSCFQAQQSANSKSCGASTTRNIMASIFRGCQQQPQQQQQQQQQGPARGQRWSKKIFRYRGGSWRSQSNNNKLNERDVNLPKNVHEKERSSIERDIVDDSCDFVHVVEDKDVMMSLKNMSPNNPNKTANGSCYTTASDDPPFMIYSMEEFPAIVKTCKSVDAVDKKSPTKTREETKCEEGFVVVPSDASISTPSFTPKRASLCEKIIKSPQKLFSKPPPVILKPCLKTPRRRVSECSDDFIEFAYCGDDQHEISFSDSESETDSEDEEDDDEIEMTGIIEEDDEDMSEAEEDHVDGDDTPEHQVDSGVEERRVHFNLTPKVHVMRAWDYAHRACRKGDYWQQVARDHERFKNRISQHSRILSPILDTRHRDQIFRERFQE